MALVVEDGSNLTIGLDGIVLGCAQNVKFGRARESKNASCTATGNVKASIPGQKSYSMSADGLQRVATGSDIATNVTVATLETAFEAGTFLDFEFGTETVGATKTAGTCWILSLDKTGGTDADATFSVTFEVTGAVTDTVNV